MFDYLTKIATDWQDKILKWKFYKYEYTGIEVNGCEKEATTRKGVWQCFISAFLSNIFVEELIKHVEERDRRAKKKMKSKSIVSDLHW